MVKGPPARRLRGGGRQLTAMMPRGDSRPQAVGRGYISISGDATGPDPLGWPVFGGQLGHRLGSTRPAPYGSNAIQIAAVRRMWYAFCQKMRHGPVSARSSVSLTGFFL